jgi:tyrosine-protein kinase Etk/Wzc
MSNEFDASAAAWGTSLTGRTHGTMTEATPSLWRRVSMAMRGRSRDAGSELAAYRRIAMQLHYDLPRGEATRAVVLAPPVPSVSGAQASSALAACLAEDLRKPVLLVDASPDRAEVSAALGAEDQRGLLDLLADPTMPLRDLTTPTTQEHLWLLPIGRRRAGAAATPDAIGTVLDAVARTFDFAVFSSGSILDNSLSIALAPRVGSVLLLAIEGETRVEDLDSASTALTYCKAPKVGLVLGTSARVS